MDWRWLLNRLGVVVKRNINVLFNTVINRRMQNKIPSFRTR